MSNQINFPIVLPSSSDPNDSIVKSMSLSSSSFSSKSSCSFTSNLECEDARDDYDIEDRNNIFARASSLSFSIDHYCLMIEKVFISFLRSYKRHCLALDNRSKSVKTYLLGNRLRVFIQEVLPTHIHYHTDFEGCERVMAISSQIDEYMDILGANLDSDSCSKDEKISGTGYQCKDEGSSPFLPVHGYNEQKGANGRIDHDLLDNESHDKGDYRDEEDMDNVDKEEENTHCGSSTSTSYSASGKVDWDDCECSVTIGKNNGFILKEQKLELFEDVEKDSEEGCDVPDFKTLVSHWRAQEKMWIEKREKMF